MNTHYFQLSYQDIQTATGGQWLNLAEPAGCKSIKNIITDSRKNCTDSLFLALQGDKFDGHDFIGKAVNKNASAVCICKTKLKKLNSPEHLPVLMVKDTTKAYQDIAAFYRKLLKNTLFIGLTGSNGKTATKDILYSILCDEYGKDKVYATESNTNNQIGVPQNILSVNPDHKFAIIEMGSNHPGEIIVLTKITKPDIAILTSVGPSHLEFLQNLKGVALEKSNIFKYFNNSKYNYAVIPSVCPESETIKKAIPVNIPTLTFGFTNDPDIKITNHKSFLNHSIFSLNWKNDKTVYNVETELIGKHQALNIAAAAATACVLGVSKNRITKFLKKPAVTGMRMQITNHGNYTIINDAYNANPDSAAAGIAFLKDIISSGIKYNMLYIVLGDMLELGRNSLTEHINTLKNACQLKNSSVVCAVGKIMNDAADKIKDSNIEVFENRIEAAAYLKDNIRKDDIIYLKSSNSTKLSEIEKTLSEVNQKQKILY
ncbi:MAG: UDP-N-acetylmuramoyl-tripeptide--D-alanyl-D-alanine ligase [Victivallales bacterium]|nr:UDP-N-acetylmuramoyl-tripeptide--D-alanyl-D-alanine ligase [Victivallales bacterium]MCF7889043.1 UDP-N-acetylmuramoyl-tripeptide--D-alanyl-D-alanine ligase [Victivallales bacterium]